MSIILSIKKYLRTFGLLGPLSFDQQVWGAKSVMDLVQHGSQFLLAEAGPANTMYTCWSGRRDNKPYAVTVDSSGHATGPVLDSSKIADCVAWMYPPKFSCQQAQTVVIQSGVVESWIFCELRKTIACPNPVYTFKFVIHAPVTVDAVTGKIL